MNELVIRWALEYDDGLQFIRRSIHNHTTNSNRFTTMYFRRTCKWQILVTVVIIPIGLLEKLDLDQSRNTVHGCCKQGDWGAPTPQFLPEQLTLSQPGADYAHHSTTCPSPQIVRPCNGPAVCWENFVQIQGRRPRIFDLSEHCSCVLERFTKFVFFIS